MRSPRRLRTGSVALGVAVSSLMWPAPSASGAAGCLTTSSDFDRDGTSDIAVGVPGGAGRSGAVQVRLSNRGAPITTTLTGSPGFGSAVTSLSSAGDAELCGQLVVGSPEESLRTDLQRSGVVYVYAWRASTKRFVLRGAFHPQGQGVEGSDQSGARFGAALAADPARTTGPRTPRLYVGAPGFDVGGVRDAGRVTSFWIDDEEDPVAHGTQTMDYGDDFTPGRASAGAGLGSSLTVGGGLVAAGAPGHTAGAVAGAGAVLVAPADPGPDDFLPQELSQASGGVPGSPEKGDRFGASVHLDPGAAGGPTLLVGSPGEDLGRTADAGAVTIARVSAETGEPVKAVRVVDQDSARMAGTAEVGDAFGSTLSSVRSGSGQVFLVGSPGEDVGRARNAGMVQAIGTGAGWTQSSRGVPGTAETGDRMGAALGGPASSGALRPLIGAPGEDDSAGAVIVGLPVDDRSVGHLRGTRAGDRYGFTVGP